MPAADSLPLHRNSGGDGIARTPKKTATFRSDPDKHRKTLRVRWEEFKKTVSLAVSLSDSPIDATIESTEAGSYRAAVLNRRDRSDFGGNGEEENADTAEVDEVVVDAEWDLDKGVDNSIAPSESAGVTRSSVHPQPPSTHGTRSARGALDRGSQAGFTHASSGIKELWGLTTVLRWRLYPVIVRFFDLSFYSERIEEKFRKDVWFTSKKLAVFSALFYFIVIILNSALAPYPFSLFNKLSTLAGGFLFTTPVLLCVLFNVPRLSLRRQVPYQIILMVCTWSWAWYNVWDMWSCDFLSSPTYHPSCGAKDFQLTSFYSTGLPFIALFALDQNRFFAVIGVLSYEFLAVGLFLPVYPSWGRNFVSTTIFHALMIYVHYTLETAERRSFTLREQLKEQCKATQKAQVSERKESDSKKRFVSYIFHEVRVPLNTALLASQNLVASKAVHKEEDIEFNALEGSLKMMSKVLNDVLDFNRMDSGRFVTVHKPYCFHAAMRSMLVPLEMTARSRGLHLSVTLDSRIDEVARRASYGWGENYDKNTWRGGMVIGDEMRLRQILTNLTSNACKFTPEGGKVHVETKLVFPQSLAGHPDPPVRLWSDSSTPHAGKDAVPSSLDNLGVPMTPLSPQQSNGPVDITMPAPPQRGTIVVRIEVRDTGVGIRPRDLTDNRLFSPYVQTEIGRFQGGKGTGLGLALVRNIVKLSNGRLGVISKVGEGSTFWVELALGVGPHAVKGLPEAEPTDDRSDSQQTAYEKDRQDFDLPSSEETVTKATEDERHRVKEVDYVNRVVPSRTQDPFRPLDLPPALEVQDPNLDVVSYSTEPLDPLGPGGPFNPDKKNRRSVRTTVPSSSGFVTTEVETRPKPTPIVSPTLGPAAPPLGLQDAATLATGSLPSVLHPPAPETPLTVLVVDDDLLTRKLMSRMLTRIGCAVDVAENGQVALDNLLGPGAHARAMSRYGQRSSSTLLTPASDLSEPPLVDEHKYAVVFLDNQMPLYSGVQVVARLRELGRETFIVGVTGNALKEDQQEYLDAGVDRILTKPVLEKDLRSMVVLAEERWKQRTRTPQH